MSLDLKNIIRRVLSEQINPLLQQLKDKYVGDGKTISEKDFQKIEEAADNKWYLIQWLTKRVVTNLIKTEDIYKWKDYFKIYEKNKNKFQHKDINLYKTAEDLSSLIENIIQVREGDIKYEDIKTKDNFVSQKDIEKMEEGGGIKYLGIWKPEKIKELNKDGYQVFDVFKVSKDNWKLYRDMLGRCKGRDKGAKIDICTIGDYTYFRNYLKDYRDSHYFVLFNLNDPLSPYQLHIESDQFMNKNDSTRYNFPVLPFYFWLSKKYPKYNLNTLVKYMDLEIPKEGEGYKDEKGMQGVWLTYSDGNLEQMATFKNDKLNGPITTFHENGKILQKGTNKNGRWVGDFITYDQNGNVEEKGNLDSREGKKGIWQMRFDLQNAPDVTHMLFNYDEVSPVSGITSDGKLRIVSDPSISPKFLGKTVSFYDTGQPKAMGTLTQAKSQRTGPWTFFFKDGSIRAEGRYAAGERVGPWTFVFKKNNQKYIYTFDFTTVEKGKLYNSKGEYIGKFHANDNRIPRLNKILEF